MTEKTTIISGPWKAHDGIITDAQGQVLATYSVSEGDESSQAAAELMAAAPVLLARLQHSTELLELNLKTVNAMIRHEMHASELMSALAELSDSLSARLKDIKKVIKPWDVHQ